MNGKPVILTGIRSNNELTLGNYLGAILPMINLQKKYAKKYQINFFVPDLHSFISPIDFSSLYKNTLNNIKTLVASGLDISEDCYIYRQSRISAHSELAWILDCFVYVGELNRMIQFKEKSKGKGKVSVGLFNYPVLMAADILLYDAVYVPVGEDQRQHLELSRDIAIRINHQFNKEIFTIPKPWKEQLEFENLNAGLRIRSLKNPEKKMSKSISDPNGTILLNDGPDKAAKKIISATTDSLNSINYDYERQPGITNLLQIYALLSGQPLNKAIDKWRNESSYGELKKVTADLVANFLYSYQQNLRNVNEPAIISKLEKDENYLREIANAKLITVQKAIGLIKQ